MIRSNYLDSQGNNNLFQRLIKEVFVALSFAPARMNFIALRPGEVRNILLRSLFVIYLFSGKEGLAQSPRGK
jgi:hypothetical protein